MTQSSPSRITRITSQFRSFADLWLAVRVGAWALVLPLLKHLLPIRALVKLVWRPSRLPHNAAREQRVVLFARWACKITRPRSGGNCLERGLITYRFLLEGGAAPTLVVGVAPGHQHDLDGHAWVLLNGAPAGESADALRRYTEVFSFDAHGVLIAAQPAHGAAAHQRTPLS